MLDSQNIVWAAVAAFAAWKLYPYVTEQLKSVVPSKSKYPKRVELLLALDKIRSHCEEINCQEGLNLTDKLAPHILKHDHSSKKPASDADNG